MHSPLALAKYTIVSTLFLGLFLLNAFWLLSSELGGGLLIVGVAFFGYTLGGRLLRSEPAGSRLLFGSAVLIACTSLYGSAAYYLDLLQKPTVIIGVVLAPLVIWFIRPHTTSPALASSKRTWRRSDVVTWILLGVLFLAAFSMLASHPITESVRSPWHIVPSAFFLLVFLIAFLFTACAVSGRRPKASFLSMMALFFLTIGIALVLYPLGYGFDPFIHQATERHIAEFGTITPKPLYYIGQYALVLVAHHGFSIPILTIDRLLLPLLATLFIPYAAYVGFRRVVKPEQALLASFAVFLPTLTTFIVTTPQGLANLWTTMVVLTSIPLLKHPRERRWFLPLVFFTLAALVTQPLAGIPAAIYVALIALGPMTEERLKPATAVWLRRILMVFGCVAIPAIFIVNGLVSGLSVTLTTDHLTLSGIAETLHLRLFLENRYNVFLDAVYLWEWNKTLILLCATMLTVSFIRRRGLPKHLVIPLYAALIVFVNYFLLSTFIQFDFLIDYEQQNYAGRLWEMIPIFLLPLFGLGLAALQERLERAPFSLRCGPALLIAGILTATVYLTYPRHDNYEVNRGFNVGKVDYETVERIHTLEGESDYIVLANQAVSSAAMDAYGFYKYYGDTFYYPIPTGSAMYQIYLEMVNESPTAERAAAAMDLVQVDTAYFVVNDYWFDAERIVENAKREADDWFVIGEDQVFVFIFER